MGSWWSEDVEGENSRVSQKKQEEKSWHTSSMDCVPTDMDYGFKVRPVSIKMP